MENNWRREDYIARVSDFKLRKRHPAGSPDEAEIAAYARALTGNLKSETAIILGMTPELPTWLQNTLKN